LPCVRARRSESSVFRAGGPMRMTANVLEHLGDEFEFPIVTSDRDVGDYSPRPVALRVAALARVERPVREAKPKYFWPAGGARPSPRSPTGWMIAPWVESGPDFRIRAQAQGVRDSLNLVSFPGQEELVRLYQRACGFRPAVGRGAIRCRHSRGDGLRRARATIEARFAEEVAGQAFLEVWDRLLKRAGKL